MNIISPAIHFSMAFKENSNIKKLKFGSGMIFDSVFEYCTSITSIDLGQVRHIGSKCFS
ncbi:MAG: leucine-rich repeat domain-containing protein [Bacteroidales bacterium]|nr:leucine-rich repeat domain-containing protein [Bacteroidales bacterium]